MSHNCPVRKLASPSPPSRQRTAHTGGMHGDRAEEAQCLGPAALCPSPTCSVPSCARRAKSLSADTDDSLRVLEGFGQVQTTGFIVQTNSGWLTELEFERDPQPRASLEVTEKEVSHRQMC